jgi:SpoVK/Ycf46/Vps4 family AAA+-type ATPase
MTDDDVITDDDGLERSHTYSGTRSHTHTSAKSHSNKHKDRSRAFPLNLRRSKREKRFVFANFTPREINSTILSRAVLTDGEYTSTDDDNDEMDPYEKILSPVAKRRSAHRSNPPQSKDTSTANNEGTIDHGGGQGGEDDDDDRGYYNLRKRRPIFYRFQPVIQVVEKTPGDKDKVNGVKRYRSRAYQTKGRLGPSRERKTHQGSSTSTSGEDSDEERFRRRKRRSVKRAMKECLPLNMTSRDVTSINRLRGDMVGSSLADVSPMDIDRSIGFSDIGGLNHHIDSLKEMIIFPLMYPEVFDKFNITPPKGVLFHGPPGCGKTLVARALANECSKSGEHKVSFFMRKGADCLSKWIGESERQLRLLFDQAYKLRPSIIFFDEIDGLAPVRSSRQDQIHSSIVSTLLALMDGLDNRGQMVIIGATNRLDAIDPALRRPGRFDREFPFHLPSMEARQKILSIHTKGWNPSPSHSDLRHLSEVTTGYCGADLKALCTESVLISLRRTYPQIYQTSQKLLIDSASLTVTPPDLTRALDVIVPTAHRSAQPVGRSLSGLVTPLLGHHLMAILNRLLFVYPIAWKNVSMAIPQLKKKMADFGRCNHGNTGGGPSRRISMETTRDFPSNASFASLDLSRQLDRSFFDVDYSPPNEGTHSLPLTHRPRLLLAGPSGNGQCDHLVEALLHVLDDIPLKVIDKTMLYSTGSGEENVLRLVGEVQRGGKPMVLYVPRIDEVCGLMGERGKEVLVSAIRDMTWDCKVLIVCTADRDIDSLPDEIIQLFSSQSRYITSFPSKRCRSAFFNELFLRKPFEAPPPKPLSSTDDSHAPLPLAPPPLIRELTLDELAALNKQKESVRRELRIFLRDATNKLLVERRFKEFIKPVDPEEVPDYFDIIQHPMDLSTIMKKIDDKCYTMPKQWLADIDLITSNAIEYNPEKDNESRLLRHKAVALQDMAHSIFDHELNEEFERQCEDISNVVNNKTKPNKTKSATPPAVTISNNPPISTSIDLSQSPHLADMLKRRSLRSIGLEPECEGLPYYSPPKSSTKRTSREIKRTTSACKELFKLTDTTGSTTTTSNTTSTTTSSTITSSSSTNATAATVDSRVLIDKDKLVKIYNNLVASSEGCCVDELIQLYSTCDHVIFRHRMEWDKTILIKDLEIVINEFFNNFKC